MDALSLVLDERQGQLDHDKELEILRQRNSVNSGPSSAPLSNSQKNKLVALGFTTEESNLLIQDVAEFGLDAALENIDPQLANQIRQIYAGGLEVAGEQFLSAEWFKENYGIEALREAAYIGGTNPKEGERDKSFLKGGDPNKWFLFGSGDKGIENYLGKVMEGIEARRKLGESDADILKEIGKQ